MQQNQGETPKILNSTSVDLKLKPAGLIYPPAEIRSFIFLKALINKIIMIRNR